MVDAALDVPEAEVEAELEEEVVVAGGLPLTSLTLKGGLQIMNLTAPAQMKWKSLW